MKLPNDICKNRHQGNSASEAANKRVNKPLEQQRVIEAFLALGGTSYSKAVARYLNKPLNSISGRLSELKMLGFLESVGDRVEGCERFRLTKWS